MEEIDDVYIESVCEDLECKLLDLYSDRSDDNYSEVSDHLNHICKLIDSMLDDN